MARLSTQPCSRQQEIPGLSRTRAQSFLRSYEEYIIKRKASQKEIFRTTEPHIPGCVLCHFSRSYWVSRVPESSHVPKARGAFEHRQRHKGADRGFGAAQAGLAGGYRRSGER